MKPDNDRKAFLYYTDWAEAMLALPDDLRLKIDDAIKRYVLYGEEPDDSYVKYSMYSMMRIKIDKDTEAYAERCNAISEVRSEAGKKGNEKRWKNSHPSQNIANYRKSRKASQVSQTSLDTVTDTVTDNSLQRKPLLTESQKKASLSFVPSTNDNSEEKEVKRRRFVPPTLEEVREYVAFSGYGIDPEKFYNRFEANGWKIGNRKMADWKAAVKMKHDDGDMKPGTS